MNNIYYFFIGALTSFTIILLIALFIAIINNKKKNKSNKNCYKPYVDRNLLYKVYVQVSMIGDKLIYSKYNSSVIIHKSFNKHQDSYFLFLGSNSDSSIEIGEIIKDTVKTNHGITNFTIPFILCDEKLITCICDIPDIRNSIIISHGESKNYCNVFTIIDGNIKHVCRLNSIDRNPDKFNIFYNMLLNNEQCWDCGNISVFHNVCYSLELHADTFSFETMSVVKTLLELDIESATKQYYKYYY